MIVRIAAVLVALCSLRASFAAGQKSPATEPPEFKAAREARDRADVNALQKAIDKAQHQARQTKSLDSYLRLALFNHWLVEVTYEKNNQSLGKKAATEGIQAAEKAVALKPGSSAAYGLLGSLYGDVIPFVVMGGPRYGPKSQQALEKALTLDTRNVEALIGLAITKMLAPPTFGGDLPKAIELLRKAAEVDPSSDTAHAWLAQAYEKSRRHEEALREIAEARRLNPQRRWIRYLAQDLDRDSRQNHR